MSFTDKESYAAMLICFMLVGFGSGTTFLAALSTGLKTIPGYPGIPIITFFSYSNFIFIYFLILLFNDLLINIYFSNDRVGHCHGRCLHESVARIDQWNR
jgi:hypothetical protein